MIFFHCAKKKKGANSGGRFISVYQSQVGDMYYNTYMLLCLYLLNIAAPPIFRYRAGHYVQCYAPIKIIGIKIIRSIKSKKSLRLMVHIVGKQGERGEAKLSARQTRLETR